MSHSSARMGAKVGIVPSGFFKVQMAQEKVVINKREGIPMERLPKKADGSIDWDGIDFRDRSPSEILFCLEEVAYTAWVVATEVGSQVDVDV